MKYTNDEAIVVYTIEQATKDGILYDIRSIDTCPQWKKGLFSHVTTNLLGKGYLREETGEVSLTNLADLLNQSLEIVRRKSNNFTKEDWLFEGKIELPSGEKQKVYIQLNELRRYTIMLPKDY